VQFISPEGKRSTPFYFQDHRDHDSSRTWQVVRSDFDALLLDNALEKGARIQQEVAVQKVLFENGQAVGVQARDAAGYPQSHRARVVLDCSGRDMVAQLRAGWRVSDPVLKKVAIWTYYRGARRDPGRDEGATTIAYLPEKGWFWYIPLPDDRVSVGAVAERDYLFREGNDLDEIFRREVETQPWIADHLVPGECLEPCRITGDFSFRSRHCAADGLVLCGDAFAFLDPVFSSGVFLALYSGVLAGDAVADALDAGDVCASRFAEYGDQFCHAIEAMRRLVYAFYDRQFNFAEFLKVHPELRDDLTDCLIGNLSKDFDPLFNAVAKFAEIPGPLQHGGPLLPSE
jgi:flavin-dependent dehydrogenase